MFFVQAKAIRRSSVCIIAVSSQCSIWKIRRLRQLTRALNCTIWMFHVSATYKASCFAHIWANEIGIFFFKAARNINIYFPARFHENTGPQCPYLFFIPNACLTVRRILFPVQRLPRCGIFASVGTPGSYSEPLFWIRTEEEAFFSAAPL